MEKQSTNNNNLKKSVQNGQQMLAVFKLLAFMGKFTYTEIG